MYQKRLQTVYICFQFHFFPFLVQAWSIHPKTTRVNYACNIVHWTGPVNQGDWNCIFRRWKRKMFLPDFEQCPFRLCTYIRPSLFVCLCVCLFFLFSGLFHCLFLCLFICFLFIFLFFSLFVCLFGNKFFCRLPNCRI
jgi:hypothetical protein